MFAKKFFIAQAIIISLNVSWQILQNEIDILLFNSSFDSEDFMIDQAKFA